MSLAAHQLDFLPSLDFPGRQTLLAREIGERLGYTERHIFTLIDDGSLVVLDGSAKGASRRSARIPIECYRAFILKRLTGTADLRDVLLRTLPKPTLRDLRRDIDGLLAV